MFSFLRQNRPHDGPPAVLEARDLASIAKYMKSDACRKVFVMNGAGVSTSAGIPDFRSPETGLYANLARLNLPYPEAVFEINFFRDNPVPFYVLAKELYPGNFRPTPAHSFLKVLLNHSRLTKCFTQNIDTLERRAGIPDDRVVEAHGSYASQRCIDCKRPYDAQRLKEKLFKEEIARCDKCNGLVKPDIVFFGESLPPSFYQSIPALRSADLLIVMGTSLVVHPFASLVDLVPEDCPRLLINLEHVGDFGSRPDDVVYLGKCDDGVRELARLLGWDEELEREWEKTKDTLDRSLATEEQRTEKESEAAEKHLNTAESRGDPTESEQARVELKEATFEKKQEGKGEGRLAHRQTEDQQLKHEVEELTHLVESSLAVSEQAGDEPNNAPQAVVDSKAGSEIITSAQTQDEPTVLEVKKEQSDFAKTPERKL